MITKVDLFYIIAAFLFGFAVLLFIMQFLFLPQNGLKNISQKQWQIESIDTMKNSRDMARVDLTDPGFPTELNRQMSDIAATGANYVAIDTPYDSEFLPVLEEWVQAARAHGLHVWFRGNFSGWEGWYNYSPITEQQHITMTKQFILANKDLFQDGDIFSSCPECENGIHLNIGDPSAVASYRSFLLSEYVTDQQSFAAIGKKVTTNYFSMNADAARAIMDRQTTQQLGGVVVIDHYVKTPQQLADDVNAIAQQSGGNIVLGEFGAPIPDINGTMTEQQQAEWLQQSLQLLANVHSLIGINYWVNKGGSTSLWRPDDSAKPIVKVLKDYYQ